MTPRGGLSLSIIIWKIGGGGPSFLLPCGPTILLTAWSLPCKPHPYYGFRVINLFIHTSLYGVVLNQGLVRKEQLTTVTHERQFPMLPILFILI